MRHSGVAWRARESRLPLPDAQSIMATCACGDEPGHKFQTFGQLLDEVVASYKTSGALVRP